MARRYHEIKGLYFLQAYISHTNKISKHGLGMAVDINTLYNPYHKMNGECATDGDCVHAIPIILKL